MQDAPSLPIRAAILITAIALVALGGTADRVPIDDSDFVDRSPGGGTVRRLSIQEALAKWRQEYRLRRLLILGLRLILLAAAIHFEWIPNAWTFFWIPRVMLETPQVRVTQTNDRYVVEYLVAHRVEIPKKDVAFVRSELSRMTVATTPEGKRLLWQGKIAQAFGISRQWTNVYHRTLKTLGMGRVTRLEHQKWVLTDKVLRAMEQIVVEGNFLLTAEEIAQKLVQQGITNERISTTSIHSAIRRLDSARLIKLIKARVRKGKVDRSHLDADLVERLLALAPELLREGPRRNVAVTQLRNLVRARNRLRSPKGKKRGHYRRDQPYRPTYTAKIRRRKQRWLREAAAGKRILAAPRAPECPDCGTRDLQHLFDKPRFWTNADGQRVQGVAQIFKCLNPLCLTRGFRWLPPGLELWARADVEVKKKPLSLVLRVRGSYRRSQKHMKEIDRIGFSWVSLLNWIRRVGRELIPLEDVFPIRWSGELVVDEKWIKLYDQWVYAYLAVDAVTGEPLLGEVFRECTKKSAEIFLLKLKARGYEPRVVVSDLIWDYDQVVAKLWPQAHHHKCVFHAERAANELVRKYLGHLPKDRQQKLRRHLRQIFSARKNTTFYRRWKQLFGSRESWPKQAEPIFQMLQRYKPHLRYLIRHPQAAATSNAAERAIKEFDLNYRTTGGYSNIHSAGEYLAVWVVTQRLIEGVSWRAGADSPTDSSGVDPPQPMAWYMYLLAC